MICRLQGHLHSKSPNYRDTFKALEPTKDGRLHVGRVYTRLSLPMPVPHHTCPELRHVLEHELSIRASDDQFAQVLAKCVCSASD